MTDQQRIDALETRIAFYEQDMERLRDDIDAQQIKILALERHSELLAQRIADLVEAGGDAAPVDERPPHY